MKFKGVVMISVIIVLLSGNGSDQLINGKYSAKKGGHVFVFSEDSTFKYQHHDIWYSESSGIWKRTRKNICLNSFNQLNKMPTEYAVVTNEQESVIVVNIEVNSPSNLQEDYICLPVVNGAPVYFYPKRGSYSFKSEILIDSIYFEVKKNPFILRGTGYYAGYDDINPTCQL